MESKTFKEKNRRLSKPPHMTEEECISIDIYHYDDVNISLWSGSFWERLKFLLTNELWLHMRSGASQPPVFMDFENPFKKTMRKKHKSDTGCHAGAGAARAGNGNGEI